MNAFGAMGVEQVALVRREPIVKNGPDGGVFDFLITDRAVADLGNGGNAVVLGPCWQTELRHPFGNAGQTVGELFDLGVPVFQHQLTGEHAFRENFRGGIKWDIVIGFFRFQREIAEFFLLETDDSAAVFVVVRAVDDLDFIGEKFFQPRELDRGC